MYTEEQLGYMELSGKAIRFATPDVTELDSLEITLEPVQDLHGYEYPWPPGGGKNKWHSDWVIDNNINTKTDGIFIVKASSISTSYLLGGSTSSVDFTLPAGTYTLSAYSSEFSNIYATLSDDSIWNNGETKSFAEETIIKNIRCNNRTVNTGTYTWQLQIESGSTVTSYAPYANICPITGFTGVNVYVSPTRNPKDGNTYSIIWETEAGTVYGGTLDPVSGKLTVTMASVDLGTLWWGTGWNGFYTIQAVTPVTDSYTMPEILCSSYKTAAFGARNEPCISAVYGGSGYASNGYIQINDSRYESVEEFKAAMNGVQLVYKLVTPVEYQLDPVTIKTLIGINNIWTDTESTISAGFYYRKELQPMPLNYDHCWTYPKGYIDRLEARIAALETAAAEAKGVPETKTEDVKTEPETTPAETEQPEEEPVTRKGGK